MARLDHAQPRPVMSIPRGVGAPPPPGLDPKRGKLMCIKVRLLDDSIAVFHLGHKALGQTLLDEVARHLNLLESDYFGLEYIDETKSRIWLEKEKPILRQIAAAGGDAKFYFIVKFYSPNPVDLEEEYTRYLFTLQIRRDLAHGELQCAETTAALLAAYLVQSDCGDFSSEDYPDANYLSHARFVPNQTMAFQQLVMNNHKNLVGMSPAESDLALLEVARRCDFYGVKLHPMKDLYQNEGHLAVMHLGIKVFQQMHCVSTFSWAKIRKLSFKRKKLLIKLHPDNYQYNKETAEFVFETRNECKNFWKKCVEHHAFFRCSAADNLRRDHRFFSKGSSFRYIGRTQKQLIDYVREHHKRREPFTRPLRSATNQRNFSSATMISDRQRNGRTHASMPHLPPATTEALDARSRRRDRCTSDVERASPRRDVQPAPSSRETESMSLSLPNVLDELPPVSICDIPLEPPKSTSGDNFLGDYDAVSEDSYGLSDNERSARSDVGVGMAAKNIQVFNTTFTAKRVGNVIVKRVVSKSNPNTDDEDEPRRRIKEFPFRQTNMVPVEIDGPNVDLRPKPVYTPSGTLLKKPRVISVDDGDYEQVKNSPDSGMYSTLISPPSTSKENGESPLRDDHQPYSIPIKRKDLSEEPPVEEKKEPVTYGAVGPLPGKILTKESVVVTPEGIKSRGPKPVVPPKPKVPPHSVVQIERSKSEEATEQPQKKLARPALISVQSEDAPDIQKCHLFNSDIPYTLTLRHVEETSSLKRVKRSPETFQRRKSLDLVPRKRLPSPGNFSSQDHTVEPMTPEGDVLEYLLRRRSMSHERSALRGKRGDPRRLTQPVRFDLPPSPCSPTKGGSTPFISFLPDDIAYDTVSESRSLHDGMDRLEKNEDSEDSDPLPPPPAAVTAAAAAASSASVSPTISPSPVAVTAFKIPPPLPPKPKGVAERVVEIKTSVEMPLKAPESPVLPIVSDSPPFIDDSPKDSEKSSEKGAEPESHRTESGLLWTDF